MHSEIRVPTESPNTLPPKNNNLKLTTGKELTKAYPSVKSVVFIQPSLDGKQIIKKRKRPSSHSYSTFIYKVLKQAHPDFGMTNKSMVIMNAFVRDLFERLAEEASRIAHYNSKNTLTSREFQTAAKLILPGELAKHAISDATKALNKFQSH